MISFQNTTVFANVYAIHSDPKLWKNPLEFTPEHFLSDDGKRVANADRMIAFSVGKRECLGKTLAEKEFFLFFANLVHRFSFHRVEGQELPSFDMKDDMTQGLVRSVPFYDMKIKMRV
jgi:cytochrome P450 family 1 subfamily A polypeptide 1